MGVARLVSGVFWELFFEHVGLEPLATPATAQESQEPAAQGLQGVLVALLLTRYVLMLKPCPSPLALAVRDVILGLGVSGLLGQVQVDDVGGVLPISARQPPQKVLGLHIQVNEVLL